jgi:hypothetical protein
MHTTFFQIPLDARSMTHCLPSAPNTRQPTLEHRSLSSPSLLICKPQPTLPEIPMFNDSFSQGLLARPARCLLHVVPMQKAFLVTFSRICCGQKWRNVSAGGHISELPAARGLDTLLQTFLAVSPINCLMSRTRLVV